MRRFLCAYIDVDWMHFSHQMPMVVEPQVQQVGEDEPKSPQFIGSPIGPASPPLSPPPGFDESSSILPIAETSQPPYQDPLPPPK